MGNLRVNHKRIITAIIITVAAAMAFCFAAAPSFAADTTFHDSEKKAAADLRKHMKQRDEKVTIGIKAETDEKGLKKMIGRVVRKATKHTGKPAEGDYITFQYESYKGKAVTGMDGFTPVVIIEYELSYYDDADQEAETDKKVSEIIESLGLEDKTNYEKISAIYDYICDNVDYTVSADDDNISRTAYSALVEGKAVCQGYCVSLYRLLLEAGIDNRIIFGDGVAPDGSKNAHTWNIVELHGEYYYVDVTWGDSADRSEYFLRPAGSGFEDTHIAGEEFTTEKFAEKYPMAKEEYRAENNGLLKKAIALAKKITESFAGILSADNG